MKKNLSTLLLFVTISCCNFLQAQIITVLPGSDLIIESGTPFSADGIVFTPSGNYTLSNVSLSRNSTITHFTSANYISRIYLFSSPTALYNGTVQINYLVSELNSIPAANLKLNIYNGATWKSFVSAVNDVANHYVLSSSISNRALNELILADDATLLPLAWRSFTATRKSNEVLLQWSTASEQNSKDFILQHNTNSNTWINIGSLPASGNSNDIRNYSYTHTNPANGINYYRILQTDLDGKSSFSEIRSVKFDNDISAFTIVTNPVSNGSLQVQVNNSTTLSLYNANGKLLWKKQSDAGMQTIDVNGYAKGIYFLKANQTVKKILIQ